MARLAVSRDGLCSAPSISRGCPWLQMSLSQPLAANASFEAGRGADRAGKYRGQNKGRFRSAAAPRSHGRMGQQEMGGGERLRGGCCCPAWAETCSAGAAGSSFGDLLSIMPCLAYEHVHCCRYVHTLTFVHTHSCSHIQTHFIHINTHMDVCACSCPWKLCLQAWGCSCALSSQDPTNLHAAWQLLA